MYATDLGDTVPLLALELDPLGIMDEPLRGTQLLDETLNGQASPTMGGGGDARLRLHPESSKPKNTHKKHTNPKGPSTNIMRTLGFYKGKY